MKAEAATWRAFVLAEQAFLKLCAELGVKWRLELRFPDGLKVTKRSKR